MKKIVVAVVLFVSIFGITGCRKEEQVIHTFLTVEANREGKIIIPTENITTTVTFVNYEVEGVIIQFIVVRGTDGVVRIAFNTCQSCNPSPNAYFKQVGEYLQCQNCGNQFHIDKIGEEKGGCNPAVVEEFEEQENQIIIDENYANTYKEKFEDWNGPTE